jgi:hypothetical protein
MNEHDRVAPARDLHRKLSPAGARGNVSHGPGDRARRTIVPVTFSCGWGGTVHHFLTFAIAVSGRVSVPAVVAI